MKGITKTAVLIMTAMLALSGCSAESSGGTDASLPEISGAAAKETLEKQSETFETPETSETDALTTAQSEESTQEETTLDEAEPIVLKVCSPNSGQAYFQNGWADKVLLERFNIKLYYIICTGWEYDRICEENPDIDIIIWPARFVYEEYADQDLSLEWDDALMEYAPYLKTYLGEYIDCVTELSGGKRCGFSSDSTNYEQQEQETVWTIGKGSTHPEAAMRLLNWLASSEGVLTTFYGPRGVCWDIDSDGYYYLTELGLQFAKEGIAMFPEEYGGITTSLNMGVHGLGVMFRRSVVSPDSVHGETYDWTTWYLMQDLAE